VLDGEWLRLRCLRSTCILWCLRWDWHHPGRFTLRVATPTAKLLSRPTQSISSFLPCVSSSSFLLAITSPISTSRSFSPEHIPAPRGRHRHRPQTTHVNHTNFRRNLVPITEAIPNLDHISIDLGPIGLFKKTSISSCLASGGSPRRHGNVASSSTCLECSSMDYFRPCFRCSFSLSNSNASDG
jgi:hypothetical protein